MTSLKSAHFSAHSALPVVWTPARFPMTWADSSDQVPPWDWTRNPSQTDLFSAALTSENYGSWLERTCAEPPKPAPVNPRAFPRLVRAEWQRTDRWTALNTAPLPEHACNDLARLVPRDRSVPVEQIVNGSKFRRAVLDIAERTGPLDTTDLHADTAMAWLEVAALCRLHLEIARETQEVTASDGFDVKELQRTLFQRWGLRSRDRGVSADTELAGLILLEVTGYPFAAALSKSGSVEVNGVEVEPNSIRRDPRLFRRLMAEHLRGRFHRNVQGQLEFDPRDGMIRVRCGLGAWLTWELSLLYSGGLTVKWCEGCGTEFVPQHGKQKWCTPNSRRCAMRAARRGHGGD